MVHDDESIINSHSKDNEEAVQVQQSLPDQRTKAKQQKHSGNESCIASASFVPKIPCIFAGTLVCRASAPAVYQGNQ